MPKGRQAGISFPHRHEARFAAKGLSDFFMRKHVPGQPPPQEATFLGSF
jgi:hypothetical protein